MEPVLKIPDAAFRFVPFDTVTFLNFAQQNVPFAGNLIELVVGQLAPGFLHFSFELFPVTFYSIPSHVYSPKINVRMKFPANQEIEFRGYPCRVPS